MGSKIEPQDNQPINHPPPGVRLTRREFFGVARAIGLGVPLAATGEGRAVLRFFFDVKQGDKITVPESFFDKVGLSSWYEYYVSSQALVRKLHCNPLLYFSLIDTVLYKVAVGELVDERDERVRLLRDNWNEKRGTSVEMAKKHISQCLIVNQGSNESPEQIRHDLSAVAEVFPAFGLAIPLVIELSQDTEASASPAKLKILPTVPWESAAPILVHELIHLVDMASGLERVKGAISLKNYTQYLNSYLDGAWDITSQFFAQESELDALRFGPGYHLLFYRGITGVSVERRKEIIKAVLSLDPELKALQRDSDVETFNLLAWAVGGRLMGINEAIEGGLTLNAKDRAFVNNPKLADFMSVVLYETIHLLVNPPNSKIAGTQSLARNTADMNTDLLSRVRKDVFNLRLETFALNPPNPLEDEFVWYRRVLGLPLGTEDPKAQKIAELNLLLGEYGATSSIVSKDAKTFQEIYHLPLDQFAQDRQYFYVPVSNSITNKTVGVLLAIPKSDYERSKWSFVTAGPGEGYVSLSSKNLEELPGVEVGIVGKNGNEILQPTNVTFVSNLKELEEDGSVPYLLFEALKNDSSPIEVAIITKSRGRYFLLIKEKALSKIS